MFNNRVDIFQRFLFYLIFSLTLFSSLTFSQNIDDSMKQAGAFYRNGEFDKAIRIYEDLRRMVMKDLTYFNLANSYRIGKLGYAILIMNGFKNSPSDEDVKHNLTFASLSKVDRIQPLPHFLFLNGGIRFLLRFQLMDGHTLHLPFTFSYWQ
jgi:hypothetical protein